jgi:hypothetical protein
MPYSVQLHEHIGLVAPPMSALLEFNQDPAVEAAYRARRTFELREGDAKRIMPVLLLLAVSFVVSRGRCSWMHIGIWTPICGWLAARTLLNPEAYNRWRPALVLAVSLILRLMARPGTADCVLGPQSEAPPGMWSFIR